MLRVSHFLRRKKISDTLYFSPKIKETDRAGNTKGGSITVPLTSCLTGLEYAV
jgi:hypothetical protein